MSGGAGDAGPLVAYDYAVLRAVPHPQLGGAVRSVPVGVVVHARTAGFLELAVVDDERWLAAQMPSVDAGLLARYLRACRAVCRGEAVGEGGWVHAVALAPPSERFHWITAPRSDVVQCGAVHGGMARALGHELRRLFEGYVEGGGGPGPHAGP